MKIEVLIANASRRCRLDRNHDVHALSVFDLPSTLCWRHGSKKSPLRQLLKRWYPSISQSKHVNLTPTPVITSHVNACGFAPTGGGLTVFFLLHCRPLGCRLRHDASPHSSSFLSMGFGSALAHFFPKIEVWALSCF